jgi:hypothetical protein
MILVQQGPSSFKKKNTKKRESFIIINNDNVGGVYIHNIVNTLVNSGLVQQDLRFGGKSIENIKNFDAIVVGDCDSTFDYDFRVVKHKHQKSLDTLDGRSFKVYDVVRDYEKVLNKIKAYAKYNCIGEYKYRKQRRYLKRKPRYTEPTCLNLTVKYEEQPKPVFAARNVSAFHRVDPIRTTEKATFFSDWVKIGMHQFDIEYDCLGNKYISDGALNKYYISEDRYGRRFLVTR